MKVVSDISINSAPARPREGWHPGYLFRDGERGAWFDTSALSALWQDTAATLPAAPDAPVARVDDLSGNGHHMIQTSAAARPVLRATAPGAALEFDGVNHLMQAMSPPSDWAWAHQQGGVTIGVAAEVSHRTDTMEFLLGTMSGGSTANTGVALNSENIGALGIGYNARVGIFRGVAGSAAAFHSHYSGTDPTKIWTYVTDAAGLRLTGRDFAVQSGWMNLPTAAGDPSLTLFMGGVGSKLLQGRIHAAVMLDRAISAAEELRLRRWMATRAGVSA